MTLNRRQPDQRKPLLAFGAAVEHAHADEVDPHTVIEPLYIDDLRDTKPQPPPPVAVVFLGQVENFADVYRVIESGLSFNMRPALVSHQARRS